MTCQFCGVAVDDYAIHCPSCGKGDKDNPANPQAIINNMRPPASVSFGTALVNFYKRAFDFRGRAVKSEYWWVVLYINLISIPLEILALSATLGAWAKVASGVLLVFVLLNLVAIFSLEVRRLHDVGKSGVFLLVGLIPAVGSILALIYRLKDSDRDNAWGLSPHIQEHTDYQQAFSGETEWRCKHCRAKVNKEICPYCGRDSKH